MASSAVAHISAGRDVKAMASAVFQLHEMLDEVDVSAGLLFDRGRGASWSATR